MFGCGWGKKNRRFIYREIGGSFLHHPWPCAFSAAKGALLIRRSPPTVGSWPEYKPPLGEGTGRRIVRSRSSTATSGGLTALPDF